MEPIDRTVYLQTVCQKTKNFRSRHCLSAHILTHMALPKLDAIFIRFAYKIYLLEPALSHSVLQPFCKRPFHKHSHSFLQVQFRSRNCCTANQSFIYQSSSICRTLYVRKFNFVSFLLSRTSICCYNSTPDVQKQCRSLFFLKLIAGKSSILLSN